MKHKLLVAGATTAWVLACAVAQAKPVVTFTPESSQIAIGESVSIEVQITGLGLEVLSAYDLNIVWNPAVASYTALDQRSVNEFGALVGNGLGDPDLTANVQGNAGGWLSSLDSDANLAATQADSFALFTILLEGRADGVTTLTFGPDFDFQRNLVGLNSLTLDASIGSACIAVGSGSCSVPEPGSYGLVGVALLAGGIARRSRRRVAAASPVV